MAHDRFVRFNRTVPTREQVQMVLEDFFRDLGTVNWSEDLVRFHVSLPGKVCWGLTRMYPDSHRAKAQAEEQRERWIEAVLVYGSDCMFAPLRFVPTLELDVLTREMDDVTNAMADGLTELLARTFGGRREESR